MRKSRYNTTNCSAAERAMFSTSLISFAVIIAAIPGSIASPTSATSCQISGIRANLNGSTRLFEEASEWTKLWKAECDCKVLATGYRLLALNYFTVVLRAFPPYFSSVVPPSLDIPDCTWKSIESSLKMGAAAAQRAHKLLDTIACYEQRGLNTTVLEKQYDQAVSVYVGVAGIFAGLLSNQCPNSKCDRRLSETIPSTCSKPACNNVAITSYLVDIVTDLTKRSQASFQLASPNACNCCLEKVGYASYVARLQALIYAVYSSILESIPFPTSKASPAIRDYCCIARDIQEYPCEISSEWAFRDLSYKRVFIAMDYYQNAVRIVKACPEYVTSADTEIGLQANKLLAVSDGFSLYRTNLLAICAA